MLLSTSLLSLFFVFLAVNVSLGYRGVPLASSRLLLRHSEKRAGVVSKLNPIFGVSSRVFSKQTRQSHARQTIKTKSSPEYAVLLPQDPNLIRGTLSNGLRYIVLPTSTPPLGLQDHPLESPQNMYHLEARLELLVGSASETNDQLGMAHLLEHVVFMDSPHRKELSRAGVGTNAFTDFHQTVFTSSSSSLPSSMSTNPDDVNRTPHSPPSAQLPAILESFRDIFTFGHNISINEPNEKLNNLSGCLTNNVTLSTDWLDCVQRLQKEQSAILSEANLVNSLNYRHESELFAALHPENVLSKRFPLGDINQVRNFTPKELLLFHRQHYVPHNAILYLTGDIYQYANSSDPKAIERRIQETFSTLPVALKPYADNVERNAIFPKTMASISKHFPPVSHLWSSNMLDSQAVLNHNQYLLHQQLQQAQQKQSPTSDNSNLKVKSVTTNVQKRMQSLIRTLKLASKNQNHIQNQNQNQNQIRNFPTPILLKQNYSDDLVSVRVFAKNPIETVTSEERFRKNIMRKIILHALAVRMHLSNIQSLEQKFHATIMWQDIPRDGCAVTAFQVNVELPHDTSLSVPSPHGDTKASAEAGTMIPTDIEKTFNDTLIAAFSGVRTLSQNGISSTEFKRLKNMLLHDAKKAISQTLSPAESMEALMNAEACGHTHLASQQNYELTKQALFGGDRATYTFNAITLEEVNAFAKEFLSFLCRGSKDVIPSAIVISTPSPVSILKGEPAWDKKISNIVQHILQASNEELKINEQSTSPYTKTLSSLLSEEEKNLLFASLQGVSRHISNNTSERNATKPGTMVTFKLRNGLTLNLLQTMPSERVTAREKIDHLSLRLDVFSPPFRTTQTVADNQLILTELGARMLQEGGSLFNHTQTDVELFSIEKDISVSSYSKHSKNKHLFGIKAGTSMLEDSTSTIFSLFNCNGSCSSNDVADGFTIDLTGPVTSPDVAVEQEEKLQITHTYSGADALFQLLHGMISDFKFNNVVALNATIKQLQLELAESKSHLEAMCLSNIEQSLFQLQSNVSKNDVSKASLDINNSVSSRIGEISVEDVQNHMKQLMDTKHMTLTVATSANISQDTLMDYVINYTSSWPSLRTLLPSSSSSSSTTMAHTPTPTSEPSYIPTAYKHKTPTCQPTRPPQRRWKRDAKNSRKRRTRIKRGNVQVFWLPKGPDGKYPNFPGGWFFGTPDFSLWDNVTAVEGSYYDPHIKTGIQPTVASTKGLLPNTSDTSRVFYVPAGNFSDGEKFPGGWFYGTPHADEGSDSNKRKTVSGSDSDSDKSIQLSRVGTTLSTRFLSPKRTSSSAHSIPAASTANSSRDNSHHDIEVFVQDTLTRGMGYIAGYGPTPLGQFPSQELGNSMMKGFVSLLLLKEMINRKLFQVVREEKQLAYDASFQLHSSAFRAMHLQGGATDWYTVTVTTEPTSNKIREALLACSEALYALATDKDDLSSEFLDHMKHSVRQDLLHAIKQNDFLLHFGSLLFPFSENDCKSDHNTASGCLSRLNVHTELFAALDSIDTTDIYAALDEMNFQDNMISCVGVSVVD